MNANPAPNSPSENDDQPFFQFQFRFSIASLLITMLIATVALSGGSYLWSSIRGHSSGSLVFFPFVLIAPYATAIVAFWLMKLGRASHEDSNKKYLG